MKKITKLCSCVIGAVLLLGAGCALEQQYPESVGSFYSLEEGCENGWLTREDLENIAYYYHTRYGETDHINESFTPSPKTPEILSEDLTYKIKRTYLNEIIDMPKGSFDYVTIYGYFGTYNDNIIVHISDTYHAYDYVIEAEHEINGVLFYDYSSSFLRIWHNKNND